MSSDGDPFGDDPYRGSVYREAGIGPCPRCDGPLMQGRRSLICPRDCGELLPRTRLPGKLSIELLATCDPDVGSLIGWPFPPAVCPLCRRTMEVRVHARIVFDLCLDHGLWLDRGEREAFERAFYLATDRRERADLEAVFAAAREAAAHPARQPSRWREVVLDALMLDEPPPPAGTAEREDQAWLAGQRVRLDDERD